MKALNSGHLRVLKNLSVIERCPLLWGNFKNIVTFRTKRFARCSWHVRYLGCPQLIGFTVFPKYRKTFNYPIWRLCRSITGYHQWKVSQNILSCVNSAERKIHQCLCVRNGYTSLANPTLLFLKLPEYRYTDGFFFKGWHMVTNWCFKKVKYKLSKQFKKIEPFHS